MGAGKTTAVTEILRVLGGADRWLAVHELGIEKYNQNNLATRLSNLAGRGLVVGRKRPGFQYHEWSLAKPGQQELRLA